MALFSTVGPNGQLTLPLAVRKLLGLTPGSRVVFQIDANGSVSVSAAGAGDASTVISERAFADLAQENATRRATAARGLAALRGGIAGPDIDL